MTVVAAMRLPASVDLSGFVTLLRRLEVPHRVSEEREEQVLWVPGEDWAEQVRGLYARFPRVIRSSCWNTRRASRYASPGARGSRLRPSPWPCCW